MQKRKAGFTLVELLVVIAIIGVLIALLLPAVQAAREAARRAECSNNLKQIGLALHTYHDVNKEFPAGAYWGGNSNTYRGSIYIRLLPFMEQENLYDQFNLNAATDGQVGVDGALLVNQHLDVLTCPSDAQRGNYGGRTIHNYAASNGPTAKIDNSNCSCPNNWNSYSLATYDHATQFAGPFSRRRTTTRMSDCTDGLSSTIYFGEVLSDCSTHVQQGWSRSNNGNGFVGTLPPINIDTCSINSADPGCQRPCNWNIADGFKSRHPTGAQFLLGDASVHFFSETIDHWTYQYLGAKADGESPTLP